MAVILKSSCSPHEAQFDAPGGAPFRSDGEGRLVAIADRNPYRIADPCCALTPMWAQAKVGVSATRFFDRASAVEPLTSGRKRGRKFLHGSPADAGDIAEFLDYLFPPREKEAVAL
jgi:hypothetical protein